LCFTIFRNGLNGSCHIPSYTFLDLCGRSGAVADSARLQSTIRAQFDSLRLRTPVPVLHCCSLPSRLGDPPTCNSGKVQVCQSGKPLISGILREAYRLNSFTISDRATFVRMVLIIMIFVHAQAQVYVRPANQSGVNSRDPRLSGPNLSGLTEAGNLVTTRHQREMAF